LEHSTFLPYINNEIDHSKRKSNKKRFESLNFITMVKFLKDPIIYPKESSWFGQIDETGNTIPMEQTEIYQQNLFGLKTLDKEKRISKHEINGLHL
jgi:palmitoyl-protein thioesterase